MSKEWTNSGQAISQYKKKGSEMTPFLLISRGERGIRTLDTA